VKTLSRKEQIRIVAEELFKKRGYAATSMRHLAEAVGIQAASLYNHYKSKELLLRDICFDIADLFFTEINKVKDLDLPPDKKLEMAIKVHILVVTNNMNSAAVFLHEWRFLEKEQLNEYIEIRRKYRQVFVNILEEGVVQGYFKAVDTSLYSLSILSAINWVYDWYNPNGPLSPEELATQFTYKELATQFTYILLEGVRK
jgi:AcrR family transcriptional regulator